MDIAEFLTPERIVLDAKFRDKAQLISEAARICNALSPAPPPAVIENALLARERLGSTGLGAGFALPHARIEGLDNYVGLFIRLARPIDFEAIDGRPVDLAFVLLIPFDTKTSHVAALAAIARKVRDTTIAARLRTAKTPALVHDLLTSVNNS
jgi:PTS system nitrogen regulatory IIA component